MRREALFHWNTGIVQVEPNACGRCCHRSDEYCSAFLVCVSVFFARLHHRARMAVAAALVMAHDLTWHRGAEEATVHV